MQSHVEQADVKNRARGHEAEKKHPEGENVRRTLHTKRKRYCISTTLKAARGHKAEKHHPEKKRVRYSPYDKEESAMVQNTRENATSPKIK